MASGTKSTKKDSVCLVVKELDKRRVEYSTPCGERRLQRVSVIQ